MFYEEERKASHAWAKVLHCSYVSDVNRMVESGEIIDLMHVAEALHEKNIAKIADQIASQLATRRIILIAGPSSSGKTSFAQRLKIQLKVMGIEPVSISQDDYFRDREDTPRKPNGDYDFECLEAVDLPYFNQQLRDMLAGKEVQVPKFDFKQGRRADKPSQVVKLHEKQPVIIEGIHCMNEGLTSEIARENKFKIYISALTPLAFNEEERLSTTQARLFRRMVRDYRTRGRAASTTILQWPDVLEGEAKYIYPYQDEADATFNSALIYEMNVLKKYAMYMLAEIPPEDAAYPRAQELLAFCRRFKAVTDEWSIPNVSIVREFIGGSCFDVG